MQTQLSDGSAAADDLRITRENTLISYPGSPVPGISAAVYRSWAAGEWAGNDDASWLRELAEMRRARAR